jgi:hypothetical protein
MRDCSQTLFLRHDEADEEFEILPNQSLLLIWTGIFLRHKFNLSCARAEDSHPTALHKSSLPGLRMSLCLTPLLGPTACWRRTRTILMSAIVTVMNCHCVVLKGTNSTINGVYARCRGIESVIVKSDNCAAASRVCRSAARALIVLSI